LTKDNLAELDGEFPTAGLRETIADALSETISLEKD